MAEQSHEAMLVDGLAPFCLHDGLTEAELDAAIVTAYSGDGTVVSTGPLV